MNHIYYSNPTGNHWNPFYKWINFLVLVLFVFIRLDPGGYPTARPSFAYQIFKARIRAVLWTTVGKTRAWWKE